MDGTSKNKIWLSFNTRLIYKYKSLYIQDAPKEILDINHHLVNYILDMDGKGAGAHDTINAGVSKLYRLEILR